MYTVKVCDMNKEKSTYTLEEDNSLTMLDYNVDGGAAIPVEDCVKYVRGLLRSYKGKSNKNVLIKVVV